MRDAKKWPDQVEITGTKMLVENQEHQDDVLFGICLVKSTNARKELQLSG